MKLKKVPKQEPEEEDDIITSEEDEEDSQEEHEPQTSYRSPAGTGTGMWQTQLHFNFVLWF